MSQSNSKTSKSPKSPTSKSVSSNSNSSKSRNSKSKSRSIPRPLPDSMAEYETACDAFSAFGRGLGPDAPPELIEAWKGWKRALLGWGADFGARMIEAAWKGEAK